MILQLVKRFWRETTIFVLILACAFLATRKDRVITQTKIEYKDKIVTKVETQIEYRDKVTEKVRTIVKKGDETRVEERTITRDRDQLGRVREQETHESERKRSESVDSTHESARYLLGLQYYPRNSTYGISPQFRLLPGIPGYIGPAITLTDRKFSFGIGVTLIL